MIQATIYNPETHEDEDVTERLRNSRDARLSGYLAELIKAADEIAEIKQHMADIYKAAADAGYPKAPLKMLLARKRETSEAAEKREEKERMLEIMLHGVGFSSTPLGQAIRD